MTSFKKIWVKIYMVICSSTIFAQQDPAFTHYMYNTLAVNPAYAGSRDVLTFTALNRLQWVGFGDGAPITQTFTAHTPLVNQNFGLGLTFINDNIKPVNTTGFYADFAYKLRINENSSLSLGLKGGGSIYQANFAELGIDTDPSFQENLTSRFLANVGAGIYYSSKRFYTGLSSPKLINNALKLQASGMRITPESKHFYFITGGILPINENWIFKPTALVKLTSQFYTQVDLTASFIVNNKVLFGANVRTGDAVGALLGYQITNQLMMSYSFDWSYRLNTGRYNNGSHEIMLRYDFDFNNKKKIYSSRMF
jgi:type IX secretion system PorP/SprF family membrane protein